MIENESQLLFLPNIILLFSNNGFQILNPYFMLCKQSLWSKPMRFYSKIIFCSDNIFLISLEGCMEDLKNL
jgi:hypothetical protein